MDRVRHSKRYQDAVGPLEVASDVVFRSKPVPSRRAPHEVRVLQMLIAPLPDGLQGWQRAFWKASESGFPIPPGASCYDVFKDVKIRKD